MMANYLKKAGKRIGTPRQSEPLDERQVPNSAGGYSYPVTDWVQLDRFLILGTEGGSYYASEHKLTLENAKAVERCIAVNGPKVVATVVEVSKSGRAPKNDPALFVLAMCASVGDDKTRAEALLALPQVARIGTHLFHFAEYVDALRGWGRGLRTAIASWYLEKGLDSLQNQLVKYQSRDGWSHRDLLRLSHPHTNETTPRNAAFRWTISGVTGMAEHEVKIGKGEAAVVRKYPDVQEHLRTLPLISAFEHAKSLSLDSSVLEKKSAEEKETLVKNHVKSHEKEVADLIIQNNLTREMVPTEFQNSKLVWEALFQQMPMTAMIRNLANMTRADLLVPMSGIAKEVKNRLLDKALLKDARIHPIQLLMAQLAYGAGHGMRSTGKEWTPVQQIVDALNEAFYLSFGNLEATGKRWYLGVDVSGSMSGGMVAGCIGLTPCKAAGAMAMVTARTEEDYVVRGFCNKMVPLNVSPTMRLDTVTAELQKNNFGSTDCAEPMLDSLRSKLAIDVFVVLTDSETWAGNIHPTQALEQYRQKMGIPSKLIVVGMVGNNFSIADPKDAGQMDVVGFDTATPQLMADFAKQGPADLVKKNSAKA
jgi:60 kDa SS-A/Ro ribonucleoprotein